MKKKSIIFKTLLFAMLPLTLSGCFRANDQTTNKTNTPTVTSKASDETNTPTESSVKPRLERTLFFDTMGGNTIEAVEGLPGSAVTKPADPTKELYTFDGWYSDKEYTKKYTFSVIPSEDTTIYAKWINPAKASKIEFDTLGGDVIEEIYGNIGDKINMPAEPVRNGYTFGGWYKDNEFTEAFNDTVFKSSDLILFAKWDLKEGYYSIKYHVADHVYEYLSEDGKVVFDDSLIPTDTVIEGWYYDEALTNKAVEDVALTGNIDLYASFYSNGLNIDNGVVVSYNGTSKNVYIPTKFNNVVVTTIGASSFRDNKNIKNVYIPSTIINIEEYAFYNAQYLEDIKLPDDIEEIGDYAFFNCFRLINIDTIGKVTVLNDHVFAGCTELKDFANLENVLEINEYALAGCENISTLQLNKVTTIFDFAFKNMKSITEFNIPSTLSHLGRGIFTGWNYDTTITASNNSIVTIENGAIYLNNKQTLYKYMGSATTLDLTGVIEIMDYAFENNNTLEVLDISGMDYTGVGILYNVNSLKTLTVDDLFNPISVHFGSGDGKNNGSTNKFVSNNLEKVIIKNNITSIPAYSFYGINNLKEVEGINNVNTIGEYAFAYTAFETFELSKNLEELNPLAFYNCNKLKEFSVANGNTVFKAINSCIYDIEGKKLLMVPSRIENFEFASTTTTICLGAFDGVKINSLVIPNTINTLERGCLEGIIGLTSLEVKTIGDGAENNYMHYLFGSTKKVETKIDPNTSEEVREVSFDTLDGIPQNLNTIIITGDIDKIDEYAFYSFKGLVNVNYSNLVTSIGDFAFYNTSITEINIPSTVLSVGKSAFASCDKLIKVNIASQNIGERAFEYDTRLEEINFLDGVKEIPNYALYAYNQKTSNLTDELQYISVLKKVTISKTVEKIGNYAFYYSGVNDARATSEVKPVVELEIAADSVLNEIGDYAFAYSHLKEAFLPSTVTKIGNNTFYDCELLQTVKFGDDANKSSLESIGELAFAKTSGLEAIYIYKVVESDADLPVIMSVISNAKRAYPFDEINENFVLYVLESALEIYQNNNDYKAANIKIKAII